MKEDKSERVKIEGRLVSLYAFKAVCRLRP